MYPSSVDEVFSISHRLFDEHRTLILLTSSTVTLAWLFNKLWMNRRLYSSTQSMTGKTVLITGGNAGIGYETVKDLLQRDARVIIACRNLKKGQEAKERLLCQTGANENNLRLMECDLCSLTSVRTFAESYNREEERLDVLICNAGLSWSDPIMTDDGFNALIQANYLGHFLLTNLLLEKLKQCRPSRVVNVSSKLHESIKSIDWADAFTQYKCPRLYGAYPASKLFQILFTYKLKQDLFAAGVNVYALSPGWVRTALTDSSWHATGWLLYILFYPLVRAVQFTFIKKPETGARTVVYCAVEPTLEQSKDVYFTNCTTAKPSSLAVDPASAAQLWKMSAEAVGL